MFHDAAFGNVVAILFVAEAWEFVDVSRMAGVGWLVSDSHFSAKDSSNNSSFELVVVQVSVQTHTHQNLHARNRDVKFISFDERNLHSNSMISVSAFRFKGLACLKASDLSAHDSFMPIFAQKMSLSKSMHKIQFKSKMWIEICDSSDANMWINNWSWNILARLGSQTKCVNMPSKNTKYILQNKNTLKQRRTRSKIAVHIFTGYELQHTHYRSQTTCYKFREVHMTSGNWRMTDDGWHIQNKTRRNFSSKFKIQEQIRISIKIAIRILARMRTRLFFKFGSEFEDELWCKSNFKFIQFKCKNKFQLKFDIDQVQFLYQGIQLQNMTEISVWSDFRFNCVSKIRNKLECKFKPNADDMKRSEIDRSPTELEQTKSVFCICLIKPNSIKCNCWHSYRMNCRSRFFPFGILNFNCFQWHNIRMKLFWLYFKLDFIIWNATTLFWHRLQCNRLPRDSKDRSASSRLKFNVSVTYSIWFNPHEINEDHFRLRPIIANQSPKILNEEHHTFQFHGMWLLKHFYPAESNSTLQKWTWISKFVVNINNQKSLWNENRFKIMEWQQIGSTC